MASRKMAKNDTAVSDDKERAERLAERCAELLSALPTGHMRRVDRHDPQWPGRWPWHPGYEQHPGKLVADLKKFINAYFAGQRTSRQPDDRPRLRKDFDDMHKAAVKFAASIQRFGARNLVPGVDPDDPPDLEAMLASLESVTMWMENYPSWLIWPSRSKKGLARSFVVDVILVVEWYTGRAIKRDTKGSPTAELKVLKEIVATVDPAIRDGTITEALKHIAKLGWDPSGSRHLAARITAESHGGEIKP